MASASACRASTSWPGWSPGVEARVREAVAALEAAGAIVEDVSLPHTDYGLATYYIVAPAEASANLARYDGIRYGPRLGDGDVLANYLATRGRGFGAEVKRRIMLGTYALSAGYYDAYYLKAQKVRTLIKADFDALWAQGFDALVAPTSPTVAFPLRRAARRPGLDVPVGRLHAARQHGRAARVSRSRAGCRRACRSGSSSSAPPWSEAPAVRSGARATRRSRPAPTGAGRSPRTCVRGERSADADAGERMAAIAAGRRGPSGVGRAAGARRRTRFATRVSAARAVLRFGATALVAWRRRVVTMGPEVTHGHAHRDGWSDHRDDGRHRRQPRRSHLADVGHRSPARREKPLAGDDLVANPSAIETRAITIDAPPAAVWPWLVQMGFDRGGWYSYDQLDMRGTSAAKILPEHQALAVDDIVPTSPTTGFIVRQIEPGRALVLFSDTALVQHQAEEAMGAVKDDARPVPAGLAASGTFLSRDAARIRSELGIRARADSMAGGPASSSDSACGSKGRARHSV